MRAAMLVAMIVMLGGSMPGSAQSSQPPPRAVTLPFTLDHNRMIVEVGFVKPDGTIRKASAWVDTGNPALMLAETLARELGLDVPQLTAGPVELASARPLQFGELQLDLEGVHTLAVPGTVVMAGVPAEANLPASVLRSEHVIFDYAKRLLTIAHPGVLESRGVAIPCRINAETGLFMITAVAAGDTVRLGVDNGSSGTWVSNRLTAQWQARYPNWPYATGAVGSANFFGFPFEPSGTLMELPELAIGALIVRNVGLLGLDQSLFDWYSQKSAGPVDGFIGANVLKGFRLEVDYPSATTYWAAGGPIDANDFDIVGLTIRPDPDKSFTIAGVVVKDGRPTVDGVQPGDKLLRAGDLATANATMGAVINALRGTPGSTRTLVVAREGKQLMFEAKVVAYP